MFGLLQIVQVRLLQKFLYSCGIVFLTSRFMVATIDDWCFCHYVFLIVDWYFHIAIRISNSKFRAMLNENFYFFIYHRGNIFKCYVKKLRSFDFFSGRWYFFYIAHILNISSGIKLSGVSVIVYFMTYRTVY